MGTRDVVYRTEIVVFGHFIDPALLAPEILHTLEEDEDLTTWADGDVTTVTSQIVQGVLAPPSLLQARVQDNHVQSSVATSTGAAGILSVC